MFSVTGSRFPVFLLRLFLTRPHRPGIKAAEDGLYIVVGLPQAALHRGDASSPMGRAMMYIASVFSQLEREIIAERIQDNMHELAKTGRSFTRFSIKSILQNPVYLVADKDAYPYFVDNEAALFSPESGKRASPPS